MWRKINLKLFDKFWKVLRILGKYFYESFREKINLLRELGFSDLE